MFMYDYDFNEFVNTVDENDVVKDAVIRYHEEYPTHEGRKAACEVEGLFHRVMAPEAGLKSYRFKKPVKKTTAVVYAYDTVSDEEIIRTNRAYEALLYYVSEFEKLEHIYAEGYTDKFTEAKRTIHELYIVGESLNYIQAMKALALAVLENTTSYEAHMCVYEFIDSAQEFYDTTHYNPTYSFADEYMELADRTLYILQTSLRFYHAFHMMNPFYEKLERRMENVTDVYRYKEYIHLFFDVLYGVVELDISAEELELGDAVEIYNLKRAFLEMLSR